jgi:hypothetical protein
MYFVQVRVKGTRTYKGNLDLSNPARPLACSAQPTPGAQSVRAGCLTAYYLPRGDVGAQHSRRWLR